MRTNSIKIMLPFIVFALVGGSYFGHKFFNSRVEPLNIAWVFKETFPDVVGKGQTIQEVSGSKLTILNFWASWCAPCVEEMPMLSKIFEEYDEQGVSIIALALDTDRNVKNFLTETPVKQHILIAGARGTELLSRIGNQKNSLPFTVLVNKNGFILESKLGKISEDEVRYWIINN